MVTWLHENRPAFEGAHSGPLAPPSCFKHHASRITFGAFTLVELLLVMTVLVMVLSISAPLLANFFHGRSLDSEARRLLALVHAGQSRAVSEGAPMVLWVDVEQRTYGLEEEPGWVDKDPKAETLTLDENVKMEVVNAAPVKKTSTRNLPSAGAAPRANPRSLPEIRFLPDGTLGEASPQGLRLFDRDNNSLWLAQARNRLNYEIRNQLE
ncbi:MAG TPA: GspH/FimT family pseudopilin [Candidatus Binatia bacterium]|jgi:type II secretion system protein H|nr:GspH/FimT family pseudopilin [Candidatus Binatia bacterium]